MAISPKYRVLLLALLPVIASGLLTTWLILSSISSGITEESHRFHRSLGNYLASAVADHVVNKDTLGVNVLLSRMHNNGDFDFASVYDSNDKLVAQVGRQRQDSGFKLITTEVTYQNISAGFIQLGFENNDASRQMRLVLLTSLTTHAILLILISIAILGFGDFLYLWIVGFSSRKLNQPGIEAAEVDDTDAAPVSQEPVVSCATFLVIKVRPARLINTYHRQIEQALALYSGQLQDTDGDDFVLRFDQGDQVFQAVCSALLLLALIPQLSQTLQLKLGLHSAPDSSNEADVARAQKHASYLASISDRQLLTSRHLVEALTEPANFDLEAFQSAQTPDGEVFKISRIRNDDLIQRQALQLAARPNR